MSAGTTPPGAANEQEASRWVRDMFGRIAGRYDLLNHLLSFNIDRTWRNHAVQRVSAILARPNARVLDTCCGTGDLLLALYARANHTVLGSDFCHPMLVAANRKAGERGAHTPVFEADSLALPLADASLDLITVGFGFRNFVSYERGLREMLRVLKPGGVALILELSQPKNRLFAPVFAFFSGNVMPWVGGLISGSPEAYSYLPESVRKFPGPEQLAEQMRQTGFSRVEFERLTLGAVAIHLGTK
jgi:demethylmenaquinone methyltransferase/2-methoxy-6-polyprenyl-1,4-benzoquinol methylase